MVRQGLATWLQVREDVPLAPSLRTTIPLVPTSTDGAGPQDRHALITVLATMVEHTQQEVAK
jgi:hypothetical protein